MSAFLCSPEHLNALVNYAASHTRAGCHFHLIPNTDQTSGKLLTDAEYTFHRLLSENLKSLGARYDRSDIEQWTDDASAYRYDWRPLEVRKPIVIIKLCHCYSYQACEHEEWEDSEVKKWIDSVERHAIGHLPGYEEAPWGL